MRPDNKPFFQRATANDQLATDLQGLSNAYVMQNLLLQLQENLVLIQQGGSGTTIVVNGANLYQLAAQYYNDATQWTTIAKANGLPDPFIPAGAPVTLIIPAQTKANTGGVPIS